MPDTTPLIVTLRFDDDAFERFQTMRKTHFPSSRNFIPAHLTLFHHLPGDKYETVCDELRKTAADWSPLTCKVSGVRFLGKGVAYDVECHQVERLRADLAGIFYDDLTAQDRQRMKPHITIQNKVDPSKARKLFEELDDAFEPFSFDVLGLMLWHYHGGPWELAEEFPFSHATTSGED
ncbi:2'-5' RNA ligase family protein [Fulvimarina endophytica]|uniref:2'-5' RNA ligase family protein n=1 Tax=Fulvimarina endophytica TaxID=2293836 RepID=A0A371WZJ8_9HYPH|nr:2'-5' RNA ligase family protein [Fulvimarina endophytica]RFC62397.1 2'-5' RNA ligase family protein [Fulvimarina endophytica]